MGMISAFKEAGSSVRSYFVPLFGSGWDEKSQEGHIRDVFSPLVSPAGIEPEKLEESPDPQTSGEQHLIEEALARGRQAGLLAGRSEAARSADADLMPAAKLFEDELSRTSETAGMIAKESAAQGLQLALEVAQQILGMEVQLAEEQCGKIQRKFCGTLADDYRLAISMHPEDLCILEGLIASGAIEWSSNSSIEFRGDDAQQRGQIKAISSNRQFHDLELQIDSIFMESLSSASTK